MQSILFRAGAAMGLVRGVGDVVRPVAVGSMTSVMGYAKKAASKAEAGDEKKKAKKEAAKDGKKLPRAKSAYQYFSSEKMIALKSPGDKFADVVKKVSAEWRAMSASEKAP